MKTALPPGKTIQSPPPPDKPGDYTGQVVYIYAYDVAHEMTRDPIRTLLGQPVAQFAVDVDKRSPRQSFLYKPQMVRLPPLERFGPHGPVRVQRSIKLLPVGAISITVQVPFEVEHLEALVDYHDLQFKDGSLHDEVRRLAEQVIAELKPNLVRPHAQLAEEEAYTVFCIATPPRPEEGAGPDISQWFQSHRRKVAALLTQEVDPDRLSQQESDESTARHLSYYQGDLVVVDWDAALLVDEPRDFDEALYLMELANLQLAELEAYDRILDHALERSYRDLTRRSLRSRGDILRQIREIRIDMARFNDELSNITKFFGDWHLARIYEALAARFHLADWHRMIEGKLRTLDDLYRMLQSDQTNRLMVWLEVTIVVLFIIDLIVLIMGLK